MSPAFALAAPAARVRRARWRACAQTGRAYKLQILPAIADIARVEWDAFARAGGASPFLAHDWLRCLEVSGCVCEESGWVPQHLVLRNDAGDAVAVAPAYVKMHSLGEYIFDQEFATGAYAAGLMYYPKLLLAVPFTPASGRRILTREEEEVDRPAVLRMVADALVRVCHALQVSSVHVNFCELDEVHALAAAGFLRRKGVQYHFTNCKKGPDAIATLEREMKDAAGLENDNGNCNGNGNASFPSSFPLVADSARERYADFEDFLADAFKSKRRIKIRRERRAVREESGLHIEIVRGDEIDSELMSQMFDVYLSTIDKLLYGRQYLNREFFSLLGNCSDFKERLCFVLARSEEDGRLVGGTFNVIGDDNGAFYGRYWGCLEVPNPRYLHFEACYYAAIEYCIEQGLNRMEPGAGGGEFKYLRGFEPAVTLSMHYMRDTRLSDAVSRYLDIETMHIDGAVAQMRDESAARMRARQGNGNGSSETGSGDHREESNENGSA